MNYATKLGAYGLAAVAAFAVAFALLVAGPISTVEAALTSSVDPAAPGSTIKVKTDASADGERIKFDITVGQTGNAATATFVSGGGGTLVCREGAACDVSGNDADSVTEVQILIGSEEGYIVVTAKSIVGNVNETILINVSAARSITADTTKKTLSNVSTADSGFAIIHGQVKDEAKTVISGVTVTAYTTDGQFAQSAAHATGSDCGDTGKTQLCSLEIQSTAADHDGVTGTADTVGFSLKLFSKDEKTGTATVTLTVGTLTKTLTVTFHGSAKNIAVSAAQASIAPESSTLLTLTVTDSTGVPIEGLNPMLDGTSAISGPSTGATLVTAATDAPKDDNSDGDFADKNELPHCDDTNPNTPTGITDPANYDAGGTNGDGKCVIKVTAPKTATRGAHTIKLAVGTGSSAVKATATINVSGKAASVTTDAPESVEPLSQTTITVTVKDDADVAVGATKVKVRNVGGGGLLEGLDADNTKTTVNGATSFTYFAGASEGPVTIVIDANPGSSQVREVVTIDVGTPAPPAPEEPDAATLTGMGALRIFSGGSVADLAAAAMAACPGGAVVWVQDASGGWQSYSTTAPAFVNAVFSAAFPDGLGMQAVFLSSCNAGAMTSSGGDSGSMSGDSPSMDGEG